MPERCNVCSRPLRNEISRTLGVGPVCSKKVAEMINRARSEVGVARISEMIGTEAWAAAVISAAEAYRSRIRRRQNTEAGIAEEQTPPVPADRTVTGIFSATRGRSEEMLIEFSDATHGIAQSARGRRYNVTSDSCSCPHFRHRLRGTGEVCRHIQAFNTALQQAYGSQSPVQQAASESVVEISAALHAEQRQTFSDIDWTDDTEREQVLETWRQNRAFDGTFMSQDSEAFAALMTRAEGDWDYKYENVLGGTGNSFGIEIEFEMPRSVSKERVARALYDAGLLDRPSNFGYHGGASIVGPGAWRLETDSSLSNGLELVSPILFDRPEHWQQIEKAATVLRDLGCKVSTRTGGHIHVGIAPLDHRTYSWQRLARIGLGFEKQFYKMGGADSLSYERSGRVGIHRGTSYSSPMPETAKTIRGTDSAVEARKKLSSSRYTLFNATNVDKTIGRKPTVEMRYPNGTLDHRQIQAQVMVANAVVHQAAVIRNESPLSRFTPLLKSQPEKQIRYNDYVTSEELENNFREFLDVLGNPEDRFAAAWLYQRGQSQINEVRPGSAAM